MSFVNTKLLWDGTKKEVVKTLVYYDPPNNKDSLCYPFYTDENGILMNFNSDNKEDGDRRARVLEGKTFIYIPMKLPEKIKPVEPDKFKDEEKYLVNFIPVKKGPSIVTSASNLYINILRVFMTDDGTQCHIDLEREESTKEIPKQERYSYGQLCQKGTRPEGIYAGIHRGAFIMRAGPDYENSEFKDGKIVSVKEGEAQAIEAIEKAQDELVEKMKSGKYNIKMPQEQIDKAKERMEEIKKAIPRCFTGRAKKMKINIDELKFDGDPDAEESAKMEIKCYLRIVKKADFTAIEYTEDFQKETTLVNPGIKTKKPEIEIKKPNLPNPIVIRGFEFEKFDMPDKNARGVSGLDDLDKLSKSKDKVLVFIDRIVGHTDDVGVVPGTKQYKDNQELSEKRAKTVKTFIETNKFFNVSDTKIDGKGSSEASLTGNSISKEDKGSDRRVEVYWGWSGTE